MKASFGMIAMTTIAIGFSSYARDAAAIPNCDTCVPAYEACVASGSTTCDKTYAACLRYCPAYSPSATSMLLSTPSKKMTPVQKDSERIIEVRSLAQR